jgi:nucleoid DNA-binding protein
MGSDMATGNDDTSDKKPAKPRATRSKTTGTTARTKAKPAVAAPVAMPTPPAAPVPAAAISPVVVTPAPVLKKKELLERVIKAAGGKKKDVKEIVEAMLVVLGDALSRGEELNLPPLGRAKVNRQKDLASGEMLVVKLRRGTEKPEDDGAVKKQRKEALAEAED